MVEAPQWMLINRADPTIVTGPFSTDDAFEKAGKAYQVVLANSTKFDTKATGFTALDIPDFGYASFQSDEGAGESFSLSSGE